MTIEFVERGIMIVVKITDIDITLNYHKYPEGYQDNLSTRIEMQSEVVLSSFKKIDVGDKYEIFCNLQKDQFDANDKNPFLLPRKEFKAVWKNWVSAGHVEKNYIYLYLNEKILETYHTIKALGKDAYLVLTCARAKRGIPIILNYTLESKFDITNYE